MSPKRILATYIKLFIFILNKFSINSHSIILVFQPFWVKMYCSYEDKELVAGCHIVLNQRDSYDITDSYETSTSTPENKSKTKSKLSKFFKRSGSKKERRKSDSSLSFSPSSFTQLPSGVLFGHSLTNLCDYRGELPSPIMVSSVILKSYIHLIIPNYSLLLFFSNSLLI